MFEMNKEMWMRGMNSVKWRINAEEEMTMYNALPGRVNIELYLALPPQRYGYPKPPMHDFRAR
jgi:hypothetical protein